MSSCWACLHRVAHFWDSFQVELQGKYSADRLHALRQYEVDHLSPWRSLAITFAVPVPSLLLMVITDVMPLGVPSDGLMYQRIGFFFRAIMTAVVAVFGIVWQFSQTIPALTISVRRLFFLSTLISMVIFLITYGWSRLIGFPVPFLIHVQSVPLVSMVGLVIFTTWRHIIKADASVKDSLDRRGFAFNMQYAMLQVYSVYIVVFQQLPADMRNYFTMLLPVIKLVFKNLVNYRLDDLNDLAPAFIVSHVDIFHTLFVSLTMQSATSLGTAVLIMVVDTLQNIIALGEVSAVCTRIRKATERSAELAYGGKHVSIQTIQQDAAKDLQLGVKELAIRILATNTRVSSNHKRTEQLIVPRSFIGSRRNVAAIEPSNQSGPAESTTHTPASLSDHDTAQLEIVQLTLKLLHMTEFYVLVEFVEVVMAFFYATYLFIISLLPNRVYYASLKGLTTAAIQAEARVVAEYAVLELVSLVVVCLLVQRRVKHHSPLKQLAFTLEMHWGMMQEPIISWVFLLFNMTLEHFGTDTTFKFEWLKAKKALHV